MSVHRERAVLVSISLPNRPWLSTDPCDEIRGLAETAGALVVGEITQKRNDINAGTYVGKGKVAEIVEKVRLTDADVVVFDNDLTPGQVRNLEKATEVKVLDRSELILDIFATRARTPESRLQVELAQLEYSLPRLKQMWTHLSRYQAGIGTRGPGETQLEEDRRIVAGRIRDLKLKLEVVQARKEREVQTRREEHTVSLVGYTNAGKSRLMNRLTHSDVYVENQLFSTLDTRTRQWHIKDFGKILLSDTVGFIRELPHHLVASFKATLEEARQARLLLHVVDASNPQAEEQIKAVNTVLAELECDKKPTILVLNKIDRIAERADLNILKVLHPKSVGISGATGEGIDELTEAVVEALTADFVEATVEASAANGKVQAYLAAHAEVYRQEFKDGQVLIRCRLPRYLVRHVRAEGAEVRPFELNGTAELEQASEET
ncbi:MAG TPA: GTPase HflX [Gemmataceae bacterium]|nr:GTPase HflX [Gemmataceae bacterium]